MKKITLFMVLIFATTALLAQECKDVIYPFDGKSIIFNCCIFKVSKTNFVHYVQEGDTLSIFAIKIIKDGQEIELSTSPETNSSDEYTITTPVITKHYEFDYDFYKRTFEKATRQRNGGIVLTSVGLGMEIAGIIIAADQANKADTYYYYGNTTLYDAASDTEDLGYALIIVGSIFETVGIPLWISGGIKRANNRKAMDEISDSKSLSFGFTGNGVGLKFKL